MSYDLSLYCVQVCTAATDAIDSAAADVLLVPRCSLYPESLVPSSECTRALSHAPASIKDVSVICHSLQKLKQVNPGFPVYKVFKRYLDCKAKAVKIYSEDLAKEKQVDEGAASRATAVVDILDDSIEAVTPHLNAAACKRKRRNPSSATREKRRRIARSAGVRRLSTRSQRCSSSTDSESNDSNASIEQLNVERSKGSEVAATCDSAGLGVANDAQEVLESDLPVWAAHVPYMWTDVFAPVTAEAVIGSQGNTSQANVLTECISLPYI